MKQNILNILSKNIYISCFKYKFKYNINKLINMKYSSINVNIHA